MAGLGFYIFTYMKEQPRAATKLSTGKVYMMKRSSLWGNSE